jgi:uncharacterized protein (DUF924 family)
MEITPRDIIDYWYSDRIKKCWFSSTPELDREIQNKFAQIWCDASEGMLDGWCETPEGCLALVILLDQFPRNMFRGKAKSFSSGTQAIAIARLAIKRGFDKEIEAEQLSFLYLPFMHSENEADQAYSVKLFKEAQLERNIPFAEHHQQIVKEFGRFPHRNAILGRVSTEEEIAYLASERAFKG